MSTPDPREDLGRLAALHSLRQSGGYKSTTLVLSLLVLTIVIGAAVLVAVRGDDDDTSAPPQVTATDTPTSGTPQTPVTRLPDGAVYAVDVVETDSWHEIRIVREGTPISPMVIKALIDPLFRGLVRDWPDDPDQLAG